MEYNSDFRYDLQTTGLSGETWVHRLLENKKIEVKNEEKLSGKTGNLYIEYQCRGKNSGISTSQADYWVFKLTEERAIVIGLNELKTKLKQLVKDGSAKSNIKGGDSNLSLGILVKIKDLM
jgi:hypothetical protein